MALSGAITAVVVRGSVLRGVEEVQFEMQDRDSGVGGEQSDDAALMGAIARDRDRDARPVGARSLRGKGGRQRDRGEAGEYRDPSHRAIAVNVTVDV